MRLIEYIQRHAIRCPEKAALICGTSRLTYKELLGQVEQFASGLDKMGVTKGARVCLVLNNSVEFVVVMLCAAHRDMTIVPLCPTLPPAALTKAMQASDVDSIVANHNVLQTFCKDAKENMVVAPERCVAIGGRVPGCALYDDVLTSSSGSKLTLTDSTPNDPNFILTLTSGSTGAPKPIVLTQRTKILRALQAQALYDLTESDVILAATPLYHSLAERLVLLPLITGGTSVVMTRFTPKNWINSIVENKVTFTIAVSSQLLTILKEIEKRPVEMKSLRSVVSSSALLQSSIKTRLIEALDCEFHECYGASEIAIATNLAPSDAQMKLETVGRACPGVDLRIMDNEQKEVPIGTVGEIACKSPLAMAGYYKNEASTAASFEGQYFLTGDMGSLDEDGYLRFVGRKKEIIITGGINVYPIDVENVLKQHEAVQECAVIGVEDLTLGEAVLAIIEVTPESNLNLKGLRQYCLSRLADYQQPMAYELVPRLPTNAMGKINKRELVEQYRDYDATASLRAILGR